MGEIIYDYTINGAQFRTRKPNIIEAFDEINNRIKQTFDEESIDIRVSIYINDDLTWKCKAIKTLSFEELIDYHNKEVWFKIYSGEEFEGVLCDVIGYDKKMFKGDWIFIPKEKLQRFKKLKPEEIPSKLHLIGTRMNVLDVIEIKLINNQ